MKHKKILFPALAASAVVLGIGCAHADESKPAVAGVNGKVDVSGGSVGREASGAVAGSIGLPVTHDYGIQLDGGLTETSGGHGGGLAAHFFRRDPDHYLIGLTSMWARYDGRDIWRNGVEAEIYLNDFTIAPSFGVQNGIGRSTGYASLEVGYYATPDLYFDAGVSGYSDYRSPYAGVEWRPEQTGSLSVFAEAGAGNYGGGFGIAGVRWSFGVDGITLKQQHREYDPPNILSHFVGGAGGGGGVMKTIDEVEETRPESMPQPAPQNT